MSTAAPTTTSTAGPVGAGPNKPGAAPNKPGSAYEVSRPHGVCAVTARAIEPGEKLMAALRETPTGFERLDICLDAWPSFTDRQDVLAFWQTVMPAPEQKAKKLFVDDEVLCDLFQRLAGAAEPAKLNFRFVLGLVLMRKRMLVYESSRNDGEREIWSVRFKGREQLMDLLNPRLDEAQVSEVSQQLGEILNEEL
jgi:hypothetical protein